MKITVIGTGYVGLVTGTCLADIGNDVLCLYLDPRKIEILHAERRHPYPRTQSAGNGAAQRRGRLPALYHQH